MIGERIIAHWKVFGQVSNATIVVDELDSRNKEFLEWLRSLGFENLLPEALELGFYIFKW